MHSICPQAHRLAGEDAKLYVVTPIINPCRYSSRYNLYKDFEKMVKDSGAILYTVEVAFGNRPYVVTEAGNPNHIQLRTSTELWHKENMINLGIQQLPRDWEYVAWVDADVSFARPDWVTETLNQLQHYDVVQMFSVAHDMTPSHESFQKHYGFAYSYWNNLKGNKDYSNWHPGFAWAARRSAINHLGGLIDYAILGAGDRHMAFGLIGRMKDTMHSKLSGGYAQELLLWEERAERHLRRNVGYVPGLLLHYWHGKKRDRRYKERWEILVGNDYDPDLDLKRDWQGLWQFTDRSIELRDDIRRYFRARNEDSIDFDESEKRI
jgi:hypothetical protein